MNCNVGIVWKITTTTTKMITTSLDPVFYGLSTMVRLLRAVSYGKALYA